MALTLAEYIQLNGWGAERILTGHIDEQRLFEGLSLIGSVDAHSGSFTGRLVILSGTFLRQEQWQEQLPLLKYGDAAALAYIEGRQPASIAEPLLAGCKRLDLPLLTLPAHTSAPDLLLQAEALFTVNERGRAVTVDEVVKDLRHALHDDKIHGLQRALYRWLTCPNTITIRHDIYAYPPAADFEAVYGDPRSWERLPQSQLFPWIECFYVPPTQSYHVRCQIMYDGAPLGTLTLGGRERPFDDKEMKVADYAAMLCAGMNPTFFKSQRIQEFLANTYQGLPCRDEDALLLPEAGFGLVLRPAPGSDEAIPTTAQQDSFLGYLLHSTFTGTTYYAFLEDGVLALYCSAEDIRAYIGELKELLQQQGRAFVIGVSGRYPRERIKTAFAEARHAASIGQFLDDSRQVFFFHDLGIYRFFNYPEDKWSINQLLDELIEKLDRAFEPEKRLVLTSTLTCLVKNKYNYTKAAEELFTHPNTIRYRIGLLEDIWDKDLSRDEDRLLFSIVGKLLPLWQR